MTIEAIAVDIDGTITDEKRQICISAIKALRKAINDNSLRYIVSMRATINATKLLNEAISKGFKDSYITTK